jgi:hypothetical protein
MWRMVPDILAGPVMPPMPCHSEMRHLSREKLRDRVMEGLRKQPLNLLLMLTHCEHSTDREYE